MTTQVKGTTHVKVLVVGAGGVGSAAAYHLARRGLQPVVLEQFRAGHDRGSSFGHSRIFRLAYDEPEYAGLAVEALAAWQALEREANMTLYTRTGGLDLGPGNTPTLGRTLAALEGVDAPGEHLTRAELQRRFPQWHITAHWEAVYAAEAGIVNPTQTVELLCALTNAHGGQVLENTRVHSVEPGEVCTVYSSAGTFSCERLVVTAGAWTAKLFPELHAWLTPTLAATSFYQPKTAAAFTPERFPIFITHDEIETYGFPTFGLPGVKLGVDVSRPAVDADTRPFSMPDDAREASDQFMREFLPDAAGPVLGRSTCLITRAPSTDFLIDTHPQHDNVVVASPCSGHGFKFMPLLGELVAAKTMQDTHPWLLPRFRWPRVSA